MIKDTEDSKGNLQFGTEVITSDDGSLAALLGASPGINCSRYYVRFITTLLW